LTTSSHIVDNTQNGIIVTKELGISKNIICLRT
jgi:hypothetical protein